MKKVISLTLLIAIVFAIPAAVYASSYYITFDFTANLTGQTRSFSGSNINIQTNAIQSSCTLYPASSTFQVSLYRNRTWPIPNDYIGSAYHYRDGYSSTTWTNVGSGNYFSIFSKATDTCRITGDGYIQN